MRLTQKKIEEVFLRILGEEGLDLLSELKGKENVSEFDLASRTNKDIKIIRKMLYMLYNNNLVSFNRKKDKQKGWYIYYWTLQLENVKFDYYKNKKQVLKRLKVRLASEEEELFFICPKTCARLNFDQAMDFEFHCPECGELITQDNSEEQIKEIKKRISVIEDELKKAEKEYKRKQKLARAKARKAELEEKRKAAKEKAKEEKEKEAKAKAKKKAAKKKKVKKEAKTKKKVTKKEKKTVKKAVKKKAKKKIVEKKVVKRSKAKAKEKVKSTKKKIKVTKTKKVKPAKKESAKKKVDSKKSVKSKENSKKTVKSEIKSKTKKK